MENRLGQLPQAIWCKLLGDSVLGLAVHLMFFYLIFAL